MTPEEQLDFLLTYLLNEQNEYHSITIPNDLSDQKRLLRSLMNVRPPLPISKKFLEVQDAYLQSELAAKGITDISELSPIQQGIYLWKGDITTLAADAIVNAANSQLLGCFIPCHGCIDNAIHSYAGIQLRLECAHIMSSQKTGEPAGKAKITKAYNLPSRYVLHTVGPIIYDQVRDKDCELLSDCYHSCLDLAATHGIQNVAFCCISTGEFHFPNKLAAEIAIRTVKAWQQQHPNQMEVIFNVFQDTDYEIYQQLLR